MLQAKPILLVGWDFARGLAIARLPWMGTRPPRPIFLSALKMASHAIPIPAARGHAYRTITAWAATIPRPKSATVRARNILMTAATTAAPAGFPCVEATVIVGSISNWVVLVSQSEREE